MWRGVLYAEQGGRYHLTLHSPASSALSLDNAPIPLVGEGVQTADVELAKGSHGLIIRTLAKSGHFELDWQPPNAEQSPIPASDLFVAPVSNNGLLGKYYPNGDWQGPPALTKVDPWIAFYFQNLPLDRPYSVEWTGRINIPQAGHYLFSLSSRDESELFIDEANIVSTTEANRDMEAGVDLTAGLHSIRLRYADRTSYTYIYLNWTPPNSKKESIPQEVLFLP
jgi:hypothetical protein